MTPVIILPSSNVGHAARFEELLAERFHVIAAGEAAGVGPYSVVATGDSVQAALARALERPGEVESLVLISPSAPADELRDLEVPTLIVFGTRDREASFTIGRAYRQLLPNSHTALIYDAGREIASERPEALAAVVGDFIDRREAFIVNTNVSRVHP